MTTVAKSATPELAAQPGKEPPDVRVDPVAATQNPAWAKTKGGRSVHHRLLAILADLPPIGKTQKNVQQGFMFRGQDDVLNALNPLLAKHGVIAVPDVIERIAAQRTTSKGSIMFEINLHVRYTFYGADGDSVAGSAWGEGTDMGDKATNKAMTMAFKYILNQVFAISTAETVDSDKETPAETVSRGSAAPRSATPPAEPAATPDDIEAYKVALEAENLDWPAALAALGENPTLATLAKHREQLSAYLSKVAASEAKS